jgi:hypothetical protein
MAFYGGPDQVMTVSSGIASVIGFLLIFWHKIAAAFLKLFGRSPNRGKTALEPPQTKTPS